MTIWQASKLAMKVLITVSRRLLNSRPNFYCQELVKLYECGYFSVYWNRLAGFSLKYSQSNMKVRCRSPGFYAVRTAVLVTRKSSEGQVIYKSLWAAPTLWWQRRPKLCAEGSRPTENDWLRFPDAVGSSSKWQMSGTSFVIKEALVPSLPNLPEQFVNIW